MRTGAYLSAEAPAMSLAQISRYTVETSGGPIGLSGGSICPKPFAQ